MTATASLIGVAIACAGNVLISVALTVQKLAHSKLERDAAGESGYAAVLPPLLGEMSDPRQATAIERERERRRYSHHGADNDNGAADVSPDRPRISLTDDSAPGALHVELGDYSPPPSPGGSRVPEGDYLRSPLWWLGLGMMGLGEAGNFVSYGFAPASVVAPLGTVALIANCVLAPLVLGESFTRRNLLGMALAIVGAVTVVWSGRGSNPRLTPDELVAAMLATPFLVLTAITTALVVVGSILSNRSWGSRYVVVDVGTCALFGGYTVMATKALSSLISASPLTALREPVAWGAIVVLVVTSVFQIKFLNRALMRFESKEVIPTQFVFFSMSAIIGSAVLYQEFRDMAFSQFVNFAFGIATTFLGVYFLTTPGEPASLQAPVVVAQQRLSPVDEETPLLAPPTAHERRESHDRASAARGRLIKRTSQSNLALGVSSQGGFLLLATTPPVTPAASPFAGRRDRASSRSSFDSEAANVISGNGSAGGRRLSSPLVEGALPTVSSRK